MSHLGREEGQRGTSDDAKKGAKCLDPLKGRKIRESGDSSKNEV